MLARHLRSLSVPQFVAVGVIVIGLITKHVVGYVAAGLALCAMFAEIALAIRRSEPGFDRVRKRIANATHWPKETRTREGAFDPYESDRVAGTVSGRRVRAALHASAPSCASSFRAGRVRSLSFVAETVLLRGQETMPSIAWSRCAIRSTCGVLR